MSLRPLPARRPSWTQTVLIDGQRFYCTFGEYPEGGLGEIWIEAKTEGTFSRGALGALGRAVSLALQNLTPAAEVVKMLRGLNFPPGGEVLAEFTQVRSATSVADWVAQEIENVYVKLPPPALSLPAPAPEPPPARVGGQHQVCPHCGAYSRVAQLYRHGELVGKAYKPPSITCPDCCREFQTVPAFIEHEMEETK